jgi:ABC-type transport system involved in multi-copper enzyme maturation permease subunit
MAEAAGQIMFRQVQASLRGKRFLAAAALVALAPVLATAPGSPDPILLVRVLAQVFIPFLLPLVAISLGSGLLHEEAEEGTLTFPFTCPIGKSAVVLGKWSAALASGWILCLASLAATLLLSPASLGAPFVRAAVFVVLLGYAAYLGMFTLLGTVFRRGYLAGLIYAFGFELVLSFVPGAAKRLSLGFYLRSLLEPTVQDKEPFEGAFLMMTPDSAPTCFAVLVGVAVAAIVATLLLVPSKEFQARNVQG